MVSSKEINESSRTEEDENEMRYCDQRLAKLAGGALAVIVMGLRPTEVGYNPIAEILGDISAGPCNRFSGGAMVAVHHIAPFLRVRLSGDYGRADEIAEQNRQMAPLSYQGLFARFSFSATNLIEWGSAL